MAHKLKCRAKVCCSEWRHKPHTLEPNPGTLIWVSQQHCTWRISGFQKHCCHARRRCALSNATAFSCQTLQGPEAECHKLNVLTPMCRCSTDISSSCHCVIPTSRGATGRVHLSMAARRDSYNSICDKFRCTFHVIWEACHLWTVCVWPDGSCKNLACVSFCAIFFIYSACMVGIFICQSSHVCESEICRCLIQIYLG